MRNVEAISDNEGAPDEAPRKSLPARSRRRDHRLSGSLERQQSGSSDVAFQAAAQHVIPQKSPVARPPRMSNTLQAPRLILVNPLTQTVAQKIVSSAPRKGPIARRTRLSHEVQHLLNSAVSSQTKRNDQRVAQAELHERDVVDFGVHKDTFEMPENFFENDPAVIKSRRIDELKELRDMFMRDAVDHEMFIRIGWLIEELRSESLLLTPKTGVASLFQ